MKILDFIFHLLPMLFLVAILYLYDETVWVEIGHHVSMMFELLTKG